MPDSANSNHKQSNRPQPKVASTQDRPRKSVKAEVKIGSEILYTHFYSMASKFESTVGRIGALSIMTCRHQEVHDRFETWIAAELDQLASKTEVISSLVLTEMEGIGNDGSPFDIDTPDEFKFTWRVTHPIFWRIAEAITALDKATSDYENMWVLGFVSDSSHVQIQGLCRNAVKNLYKRMRHVAYKSKDRKGGLFSDAEYQSLLKDLNIDVSEMGENEEAIEVEVAVDSTTTPEIVISPEPKANTSIKEPAEAVA